jgi:hypothetical protein
VALGYFNLPNLTALPSGSHSRIADAATLLRSYEEKDHIRLCRLDSRTCFRLGLAAVGENVKYDDDGVPILFADMEHREKEVRFLSAKEVGLLPFS